ncbi:hypothetical protein AVEN_177517-1 [Araneus ventricosus]|uniref:Uncharacterized protein n=1 Tax=Araneus ventricosus TaxID=182803 RepID=A0A4Y2Q204_ARAVE|nr:hypothetical protein AVEN_177517-1 [Araneus ventricosus]
MSWETRTDKDISITLIPFDTECRIEDIKKELRKLNIIPNECVYAVHFKQFVEACTNEFKKPWFEPRGMGSKDSKTPDPSTKFNHILMVVYAIEHEITDVYRLTYEYAHLVQNLR